MCILCITDLQHGTREPGIISHMYIQYHYITELSSILQELEKMFDSAQWDTRKRVVEKEERIESAPLNSVPPAASTKWTVDKEWLKGHHSTHPF